MHLLQRSEYSLRESIVAGTGKVQLEWNIEYLFWALLSSRCYSCWTSAAAPVPVAVHYEEIGKQFVRVARAIIMDTALPLKMVTVEHFTKGKIRTEVKAILKRRVDFLMFKLIIGKLLKKKKKKRHSVYIIALVSLSLSLERVHVSMCLSISVSVQLSDVSCYSALVSAPNRRSAQSFWCDARWGTLCNQVAAVLCEVWLERK